MNRRHALADPATLAAMSGREWLQAIVDGQLPQAPVGQPLAFHLIEVGEGVAVFEGEPGPALLNPLGTVHGGFALTLIDSACGAAVHSLLPAGTGYTTVETKGHFARPITPATGRVRAEGRVVAQGRRIMSAEARVLDAQGRVLAHGTSTLLVLEPRAA